MDQAFQVIDDVMKTYVSREDVHNRWLIHQALATAAIRRAVLRALPIRAGMRVLDIGCGFGALTFDIAALYAVQLTGIDRSSTALAVAKRVEHDLRDAGAMAAGCAIEWKTGDAEALPLPDNDADVAVSRFLFQHLTNPNAAVREIFRVLKPGGFTCLIDADDALSLEYPVDPVAAEVRDALSRLQQTNGGDRHMGRKLASLLAGAGLSVVQTFVVPQAHYAETPSRLARLTLLEQLRERRAGLIETGIISQASYEALARRLQQEPAKPQFSMHAEVAVIAKKPA
ncbi:class I SAM-dependent methyltransferase [Alicyclobacillus acidocaldarius]|uniref:class I SAM-dependent methyltransferase n=1 Tax=Alicyclobacillus acidocaldarius TaxID=405212 RepID=UPI00345E99F8